MAEKNVKKTGSTKGEYPLGTVDAPVVPFIEGDGIGPDVWRAARMVLEAGVKAVHGGDRKIQFVEVLAGEKSFRQSGQWLPQETLDVIKRYKIAIKGPLTTPVGEGQRSINVTLRQELELFCGVRPIRYIPGVPSPVKSPELTDVVIFRENMEDLYRGIEWEAGSKDALEIIAFLAKRGITLAPDTGIGIKPMSRSNTQRLVAKAIEFAIKNHRTSVTLMHKGNIMKFTEGAFKRWGYEVAAERFPDQTITEQALFERFDGKQPPGRVVIKDRIADSLFQQLLLRPDEYDVIAAPNLNGDYVSDALAAQVGGLGLSPGANMGEEIAFFEATHGTAPKYAGLDKVNPGSLILSGVMMLEHMGWNEAAGKITRALEQTISEKIVTYDLARQIPGAVEVKCSAFARAICDRMV
ncbi:Icd [Desulforapulum autotrophicum HRM2]|uniref:Isocitrate dehydrogenase [NADP] n=1 Tax=Desulforapulum autotrophicum (strain ATCC 43914 / DSM 3382 / VKM B-1955 / HRM2) TaxID=177437 RepID=C0QCE3_DESAH|nr:isocitrate dehydrogenase (NADP(+)) [Desulforapulum autotrophicum]ACN17160.1 Icd [Desulforapulum autotrophicum HRM2]